MKRVFQHPPEAPTDKRYWRSVGEYSNTAEFREWLEHEFPAGASELEENDWSRRDFMKLMGASMALAGIGLTSCRRPQMHMVPFTKSAEWTIPGKALYYATPTSFGENVRLLPRFDRADVVLALDSDFLDCGEGDLASARAFTARRRVKSAGDSMNRLYVVENRFTVTGAMADHRLRLPASQIPAFAHSLARKIAFATKDPCLGAVIDTLLMSLETTVQYDIPWLN